MTSTANRTDRGNKAPGEEAFVKVVTPFEKFIHHESTSGLTLMACALLALANAGIRNPLEAIPTVVSDPITLGTIAGLVFCKLIGIPDLLWLRSLPDQRCPSAAQRA